MSASLKWQPHHPERGKSLGSLRLREGLRNRFHVQYETGVYGSEIVPYLEGLVDSGDNDAQVLIEAIGKYGSVELWIEN